MSGKIHIVVPDSHAHPDFDNSRYDLLGHLIADVKPDVVVDIGDWFDMPSLCSYDKGKKSFEGRRYNRDIASGIEAQDRVLRIVKRQKQKFPRFVRTLGNHENRINRVIEFDAVLDGTIGTGDLLSKEYKWEEHPFLEPVEIDGITYQHYFTSGVLNRPIGGERPAYTVLMKNHVSCTQGHSHLFDYCIKTAGRRKIHGLHVGVFQDYNSDYAGPANELWDRGVVIKRNVEDGHYDLEWVSLKRLKEIYGG